MIGGRTSKPGIVEPPEGEKTAGMGYRVYGCRAFATVYDDKGHPVEALTPAIDRKYHESIWRKVRTPIADQMLFLPYEEQVALICKYLRNPDGGTDGIRELLEYVFQDSDEYVAVVRSELKGMKPARAAASGGADRLSARNARRAEPVVEDEDVDDEDVDDEDVDDSVDDDEGEIAASGTGRAGRVAVASDEDDENGDDENGDDADGDDADGDDDEDGDDADGDDADGDDEDGTDDDAADSPAAVVAPAARPVTRAGGKAGKVTPPAPDDDEPPAPRKEPAVAPSKPSAAAERLRGWKKPGGGR
jgi:hypothetical protein